MSFWRELFQNSVDAGAKAIRVSSSNEAGKGSFGRDPSLENVVRIVFDDDGCGMDRDVLDDVYFAPGETTKKDGEFTGGYGRARLMTCFSQVRYGIRSEEHTSELQSLMRISYAVFCLKKKNDNITSPTCISPKRVRVTNHILQ